MTDDQGYGDFGATGNPVFETPHIDALARRSAMMATFYVSPVCAPTRACLMTGRYNYRTRAIDTYIGRAMMEPDEVTIAEVLRDAGYSTGIFGKWHLGDCYPLRAIDQGFEEALVLRGGGLGQPSDPRETAGRYTDPTLFRNGEAVETHGYCTDLYFDAALDFIDRAHSAGRPFFAYIPTNAPHGPFHDVPKKLLEHYLEKRDELAKLATGKNAGANEIERLARIAAMITNVDENMGRLFAKLDALGAREDTVVIFLVDNGPNTARYVGPFRGHKGEVWEGGVRSPLWIEWPGHLRAGTVRREPAAHIDIFPTILSACGVDVPSGLELDGRSFLGLLTGEDESWPERTIVIQSQRGDVPVRYHNFLIRDERYKLVHPSGFGPETFSGEPRFQLFDLIADPGETKNLAAEKPDVAAKLRAAYDAWFDDVSSTRPDNYAPPRIRVGTAHENPTVLTRQDWRGGTWARDSIGSWLLEVEPGTYDVRFLFDPAKEAETAELDVAGIVRYAKVTAGEDGCTFRGVELPGGEATLRGTLAASEGERRGVYQVEVRRKDD